MKTIKKSASVKVMLSYNYNHFESSIVIENEEGLTVEEIDEARKDCARLCDKAIIQYKQAKIVENKTVGLKDQRERLEIEVEKLREKEGELTNHEKAKIKTLEDFNWNRQWDYEDDFDEDDFDSPEMYCNDIEKSLDLDEELEF